MCFLWYFQEYNQTSENIFRNFFWNATKHMKTFSFPENSISGKYLFSGNTFTRTKRSLNWNENFQKKSIINITYYNFLVGATQNFLPWKPLKNWIYSRLNSTSTLKWIHSLYLNFQIFIKHDWYQFNNQIDCRKINLKNMSYPPVV